MHHAAAGVLILLAVTSALADDEPPRRQVLRAGRIVWQPPPNTPAFDYDATYARFLQVAREKGIAAGAQYAFDATKTFRKAQYPADKRLSAKANERRAEKLWEQELKYVDALRDQRNRDVSQKIVDELFKARDKKSDEKPESGQ